MKNFLDFISKINSNPQGEVVSEAVHADLQSIMDSDSIPAHEKLNVITKHVQNIKASNGDTGLIGDTPKKGSSRAVFFPRDPKTLVLDGIPARIPTAIKIAHQGEIEKSVDREGPLLGQMQNEAEADPLMAHHHGMIRKNQDGTYHTNPDGVIPPVFSAHQDHHHIEVGRVSPFHEAKFKEATTDSSFPNGITHDEFHDTIQHIWAKAHGMSGFHHASTDFDRMDNVLVHHPFVKNTIAFCSDTNTHPSDFVRDNIGTWTHPHTGKLHPILLDYGFQGHVVKAYQDMFHKYEKAKKSIDA